MITEALELMEAVTACLTKVRRQRRRWMAGDPNWGSGAQMEHDSDSAFCGGRQA